MLSAEYHLIQREAVYPLLVGSGVIALERRENVLETLRRDVPNVF